MSVALTPTGEVVPADHRYRYLEPKPYKQTKQLGIVGRNMTVWNLVAEVINERMTPAEVAVDYDLPVEAVEEALSYYQRNRDMIDAEVEATGRRLGLR